MKPRNLIKPTGKQIRNTLNFWAGGTDMEQTVKRGPQPENNTHHEIAAWRNRRPNLFLERNKRRLATPVGYHEPIMLGWMADGSGDWIGWESVEITPSMVGKRVAVFVAIESKRLKGGALSDSQEAFLNKLADAGGISGAARSGEQASDIVARWYEGMAR